MIQPFFTVNMSPFPTRRRNIRTRPHEFVSKDVQRWWCSRTCGLNGCRIVDEPFSFSRQVGRGALSTAGRYCSAERFWQPLLSQASNLGGSIARLFVARALFDVPRNWQIATAARVCDCTAGRFSSAWALLLLYMDVRRTFPLMIFCRLQPSAFSLLSKNISDVPASYITQYDPFGCLQYYLLFWPLGLLARSCVTISSAIPRPGCMRRRDEKPDS